LFLTYAQMLERLSPVRLQTALIRSNWKGAVGSIVDFIGFLRCTLRQWIRH